MLHLLIELFTFGTIAFWIFAAIVGIIMAALVEHEHGGAATWITICFLIGLNQVGHVPVWNTIRHHPYEAVIWFFIYLTAGLVWALLKWTIFCFKERRGLNTWHENLPKSRPIPKNEQDRIMGWIGYWPLSIAYTLFDDFVAKAVRLPFDMCESTFDHISRKIFTPFGEDPTPAKSAAERQANFSN